jgi:hypothetical protein
LTNAGPIDKLGFDMKGVVIPSFPGLLRGFICLISLGLSNESGMM